MVSRAAPDTVQTHYTCLASAVTKADRLPTSILPLRPQSLAPTPQQILPLLYTVLDQEGAAASSPTCPGVQ